MNQKDSPKLTITRSRKATTDKTVKTVTVSAARYADYDNCLAAACDEIAAREGIEAWQCEAQWGTADGQPDMLDRERETILITFSTKEKP